MEKRKEILQRDIVPGDIILLRAGDKVSADARIIEIHNLRINESSLTGEWLPAKKKIDVLEKGVSLADRDNMVYLGTIVENGWGKAVVIKTGEDTELGNVASMVREAEEKKLLIKEKYLN